ncbi:MAG: class I SAM-dependent methyltransferase, partial [Nitrosopumilaceae archaeon]
MIELNFKNKILELVHSIKSQASLSKERMPKGVTTDLSNTKSNSFDNYDHYKDQYWNNLELVQQYVNKNATGNKNTVWQIDILTRFKSYIPFNEVLIIGCGNGWVERQLFDLGIGLHFDAFDVSEKYLETAQKLAANRHIHYFKADINHLENLGESRYDAIFNVGVLH